MLKYNGLRKLKYYALAFAAVCFVSGTVVPSAAADTLDEIKAKGTLVVGSEAAYEPFDYMEDGKVVGYNIDIITEIAQRNNLKLEKITLPFTGLLPALLAKKLDFVVAALTVTPERVARYAFTRPVSDTTHVILVREGDDRIKTLEDLSGKVVAGQLASSFEKELRELDARLKSEGKAGLGELKLFVSLPEMQVALASRQLDAITISTPMAAVLMKKRPGLFKIAAPLSDVLYLAWAARPEDTALRDFINEQIGLLKADGTLRQLQDKWFGAEVATPESGYMPEGAL